jgi:CubicO group peptidase (beta-lactamase class C family)
LTNQVGQLAARLRIGQLVANERRRMREMRRFWRSLFEYKEIPMSATLINRWLARAIALAILVVAMCLTVASASAKPALAGYIVERVAGQPFAQYIQQHIFAPMDMRHSTFTQQLPPDLAAQLAISYDAYDDKYHAMPFEYFQIAPAGGLSATATDMAQFMIAQLQDGRLGDVHMLQAASTQDMHRQHFANDPHVNGMTYGFAEMTLNGQHLLMHSGTTNDELFRSLLALLPAQHTGLFVSYSGAGGGGAKWDEIKPL